MIHMMCYMICFLFLDFEAVGGEFRAKGEGSGGEEFEDIRVSDIYSHQEITC